MDANDLHRIIDRDFAVPRGKSADDWIGPLFGALGAPDAELRENALTVLCEWIERGCYEDTTLLQIGARAAGNLPRGIGETGTDGVFLRSFSVLVLATVIAVDEARWAGEIAGTSFLEKQDVLDWLDAGLSYLKAERDRRGYVPGKGWAHAAAHAADLLRVLARSRYVGHDALEGILRRIGEAVSEPVDGAFLHQEDDRLAASAVAALQRGLLDHAFLTAWLDGLVRPSGAPPWATALEDERRNNARMNLQSFLRGLYFQLLIGGTQSGGSGAGRVTGSGETVRRAIVHALRHMDGNRFYDTHR